jgi:putative FmdB family regulatory protein
LEIAHMPTYDYECGACGHAFEKFQSITSPVIKKCPLCGKLKLRRLIGAGAGIIFKGSGFYQTDYRSESYRKGAQNDSGAGGKSSKGPAKGPGKGAASGGDGADKKGSSRPDKPQPEGSDSKTSKDPGASKDG